MPTILRDFSAAFTSRGFQVYLVGGAVRDRLLGKRADDWDVATNARPEEVLSIFPRVIPTGIQHGTVTIPFRGAMIECTTFRAESEYSDGRRPDSIRYASSIEEDLSRRDFTMNAIAVALPLGEVIDPFDGRGDIARRLIKTVGDPAERFSEDGLRTLRAVRFSAMEGFTLEKATLKAIPGALAITSRVAQERVRDELIKLLSLQERSKAFLVMEASGLMDLILPELTRCRGIEQGGRHRHDVLDHLLAAVDASPRSREHIALAALLHDVGKPASRAIDANGEYTFHGHERESAAMAGAIMTRLKFPNKEIARVTHLIREHMFHYEPVWTDAAVRRFIARVGEDAIEDLFALRRCDAYAISHTSAEGSELDEFRRRIDGILAQKHAFTLKDLACNGYDLCSIGIPPGKTTGIVLKELLSAVLDDPSLNEKGRLLEIAGNFVRDRGLLEGQSS